MRILAIFTGRVRQIDYRGRKLGTGIFKEPAAGPVRLGALGLEGDEQADPRYHGGRDKALYVYGKDAVDAFKARHPEYDCGVNAFGENVLVEALDESDILSGDVFELGEAKVQAALPRLPCYKLGLKYRSTKVVKRFLAARRPGVYFRVLREGLIRVGDELRRVERSPGSPSIARLFDQEAGGE